MIATGAGAIVLSGQGRRIAVYVNVAFITGKLIEAEVDTENAGSPLPAATQSALVAKVATRAANA